MTQIIKRNVYILYVKVPSDKVKVDSSFAGKCARRCPDIILLVGRREFFATLDSTLFPQAHPLSGCTSQPVVRARHEIYSSRVSLWETSKFRRKPLHNRFWIIVSIGLRRFERLSRVNRACSLNDDKTIATPAYQTCQTPCQKSFFFPLRQRFHKVSFSSRSSSRKYLLFSQGGVVPTRDSNFRRKVSREAPRRIRE